jgi:hypothetical protein
MRASGLVSKWVLVTALGLPSWVQPGAASADPTLTTLHSFSGNDGSCPERQHLGEAATDPDLSAPTIDLARTNIGPPGNLSDHRSRRQALGNNRPLLRLPARPASATQGGHHRTGTRIMHNRGRIHAVFGERP